MSLRILNELSTYRLLSAISLQTAFGARDHALIRLALQTGLRVSELTGLDVGLVWGPDGARHWLDLPHAIAKNHKSRRIPLSAAARRAKGYTWSTTAARLRRLHTDLKARSLVRCA